MNLPIGRTTKIGEWWYTRMSKNLVLQWRDGDTVTHLRSVAVLGIRTEPKP